MTGNDDDKPVEYPKIDPSSPYFLGSQDGPGQKISNIMLRRDNYADWKQSMTMSLKSRRKYGFVNGSIKKPTNKFDLENWEVVHCTLVQWIRNMIDPSILDTVSYVDDASVLWAELQAQFDVVDGTKIHGLKTQLHNCKQIKGDYKDQVKTKEEREASKWGDQKPEDRRARLRSLGFFRASNLLST